MFLGLRLTDGVNKEYFKYTFNIDINSLYADVVTKLENQGLIVNGKNIMLTDYGIDVSNIVLAEFLL